MTCRPESSWVLSDLDRIRCRPRLRPDGTIETTPTRVTQEYCDQVAFSLCNGRFKVAARRQLTIDAGRLLTNRTSPISSPLVQPGPATGSTPTPTVVGGTYNQSTSLIPSGDGPGAIACGLAGFGAGCTYADLVAKGAQVLTGGGGGGEAQIPSGDNQAVPGNFAPSGGGGGGGCQLPAIRVNGTCVDPTAALPGGRPFTYPAGGGGELVYGMYGIAMVPAQETRTVSRCGPGMVLGKDGLCYESLPRGKRKWNPGAKPLLTGGEMNAIRRAERAARRVAGAKKKIKTASKMLGKAC